MRLHVYWQVGATAPALCRCLWLVKCCTVCECHRRAVRVVYDAGEQMVHLPVGELQLQLRSTGLLSLSLRSSVKGCILQLLPDGALPESAVLGAASLVLLELGGDWCSPHWAGRVHCRC